MSAKMEEPMTMKAKTEEPKLNKKGAELWAQISDGFQSQSWRRVANSF